MQYQIVVSSFMGTESRSVIVETGSDQFQSFPAYVGNPVYDLFLESQSLTDAEVQAMEPDVWHDMA